MNHSKGGFATKGEAQREAAEKVLLLKR